MDLPRHGRPVADVIADLRAKRTDDVRWDDGRAFSLVYDGGPSVHEVAEQAALMYLHENALNTAGVPVARADPVRGRRLDGRAAARPGHGVGGFLTSGGTESIQCAVLAARERGRIERGVTDARDRARRERPRRVPQVGPPVRHARPSRRRCATTGPPTSTPWPPPSDRTRCSSSARRRSTRRASSTRSRRSPRSPPTVDANCHVDACMGGFVLPFAELLGRDVPPWDFRVDGVHSISADVHKLGYAPKGVSVILHRTKELRRVPDVRVRRVARRAVRLAEPAGHPLGAADGRGVGGDAAPRRRRLRRADPGRRWTTPTGCAPAIAAVDGLRVLGDGGCHLVADRRRPGAGDAGRRVRRRRRAAAPGLATRPPGPAGLAALDGQQRQRRRHRRVAGRPRRLRRRGPRRAGRRPLDDLRHAE